MNNKKLYTKNKLHTYVLKICRTDHTKIFDKEVSFQNHQIYFKKFNSILGTRTIYIYISKCNVTLQNITN